MEGSQESDGTDDADRVFDMGMGTFCLALLFGILARAWIAKRIKLPYTVIVLLIGLIVGFVVLAEVGATGDDMFSRSLSTWINLPPEAILFTILPILIFETSFSSDLHLFMQQLGPVLTLAVPVVVFNTVLIGATAMYVLPYGWDLWTAFMFGGMMSATDPVAVVAILKELGIAESLSVLIEGESLLNDGTAIVVFSIFSYPLLHQSDPTAVMTLRRAVSLCVGGPLLGVLVGAASSYVLGFILNDPPSEITVTVVCCFGAYVLAEGTGLHASGVLSIVCAGLYLSFYGLGRISARVVQSLHSFWQMAGYITNTLIFFMSGLIMAEKALVSSSVSGRDWGYMLLLYLLVNLYRAVSVVLAYPIICRGAYGINWKQGIVLAWSGLRGAVSLTLALAVHQEQQIPQATRDRILFLTAGVVLLSILINGTSSKSVIDKLGLSKASSAEKEMFQRAMNVIESRLEGAVHELKKDKYLGDADWAIVWRYIPVPTKALFWHRIQEGNIVLVAEEVQLMEELASGERLRPKSRSLRWLLPIKRWGRWTGLKYDMLPPRLRSRWRRYTLLHNDLRDGEAMEKLRGVREKVLQALSQRLRLTFRGGRRVHDDADHVQGDGQDTPGAAPQRMAHLRASESHIVVKTPQISRQTSFTRQTLLDSEPFAHGWSGEPLPEARLRLLYVLKHIYWGSFQTGLLSPAGIRAFERNVALLSADTSKELHEWSGIEKTLILPLRAVQGAHRWRKLPLLGGFIQAALFERLAFLFELAVVFIEAHSSVNMEDLFGSGPISKTLAMEVNAEIRRAKHTLKEFLPVFPDIFNSVKTEIATRYLLHRYRSLLEDAFAAGSLNAKEFDSAIKEVDSSMVKLYDHTHAEDTPSRVTTLSSAPFLRFVPHGQLLSIFDQANAPCRDVYVRAERCFILAGQQNVPGWYLVVRGSVVAGEGGSVLPSGSVIGLTESLLKQRMAESYTAASFVHMVYFDRSAMLAEADRNDDLMRSLWWLVGANVLRDLPEFEPLTMGQLGSLLAESRCIHAPRHTGGVGILSATASLTLRLLHRPVITSATSQHASEEYRKLEADGSFHVLLLHGRLDPLPGNADAPLDTLASPVRTLRGAGTLRAVAELRAVEDASETPPKQQQQGATGSQTRANRDNQDVTYAQPPVLLRNLQGRFYLRQGTVAFILAEANIEAALSAITSSRSVASYNSEEGGFDRTRQEGSDQVDGCTVGDGGAGGATVIDAEGDPRERGKHGDHAPKKRMSALESLFVPPALEEGDRRTNGIILRGAPALQQELLDDSL